MPLQGRNSTPHPHPAPLRSMEKILVHGRHCRRTAGRPGWIRISKAGHVPEFFADVALGYTQDNLKSGSFSMPRKVRELVADLLANGFLEVVGGGKGSHRKFVHDRYPGALTVSGHVGDDAKPYQEKQVRKALEEIHEAD